MLTWTARGALNVTILATGQENVLPTGIAHEHRRPKLRIRGVIWFFFYLYANVQRNVTWGIYFCLTIELDHAKSDSRLTAYGGVVLQRFEGLNL